MIRATMSTPRARKTISPMGSSCGEKRSGRAPLWLETVDLAAGGVEKIADCLLTVFCPNVFKRGEVDAGTSQLNLHVMIEENAALSGMFILHDEEGPSRVPACGNKFDHRWFFSFL